MPMKTNILGAHVTIEVPSPWRTLEGKELTEHYRKSANSIISDIRRHVDDTDNMSWDFDKEKVCEFCGAPWTEDDKAPHNGGCCAQDAAIMLKEDVS